MGATQEHLALKCRRGAQDPPSQLRDRSEAGPEQAEVGYYLPVLLPYMPAGIRGMSE